MKAALLAVVGIFGLTIAVCAFSYVGNFNYGNEAERRITAQYENLENILSQFTLKVQEAAQVPEMYANDLKAITTAAMTGRYGDKGSQATWQWLKEQNPNLDQAMYQKVQTIIESGRNQFQTAQTEFIDSKRAYETNLGYLWKGAWLRVAGYPKLKMENFRTISSESTKEAFRTGVDKGVTLRPRTEGAR